jgi:8-oxo-dGTP diphosphatase
VLHDCVGALLVRNGELLLGRRAARREWLADAWDVFGGHIEQGETGQQALSRELREELGVVPTRMRHLGTLAGDEPEPWRLGLYAVTAWTGEPRNLQSEEHAQLRWCPLAEAVATAAESG